MRRLLFIAFFFSLGTGQAQDYFVNAPYTSPSRNTCGAANNCALGFSEDHQYQVTIPTAGNWTFSLCGSAYDTRIYVGSALCLGDLGNNDDACGLQSEITLAIGAGTYHVTVEGWSGSCGNYVLDISSPPSGGPGSDCTNPIVLNSASLPYTVTGDDTGNYGDNYSTSPCSGTYIGGDEVVYTYTAGASAELIEISAVFTDSWGGIHVLNDCPNIATACIASSFAGTATSAATPCVTVPAGTTYYIVISTFPAPQTIGFDLSITACTPAGPEDNCAGALPINCGDVATGNTSSFAPDVAPFCGTGDGTGGGVWYSFLGTGDFVTASLCGSGYDTKIRVFEGSCPSLVCVTGSDDDCGVQSEVSFTSTVGTTYYILVHGFGSSSGPYALSLTCGTPPPAGPEDCAGAATVCNSATFTGNSSGSGSVNDLDFANDDCLSGENQSSWYFFQAQTAGSIAFEIVTSVDYDFAVWGPYSGTPSCSPAGLPIRCSYSALAGNTGLQSGSGDTSEPPSGDAWVDPIAASAGDTYILCIDNFTSDFSSFDLTWDLSGGATLDCTPLPIELIDFRGYSDKGYNILEWSTASEINNSYFTIERSKDGSDFEEILHLDGAGNSSSILEYSARDTNPLNGNNYYRLKQTDFDGQYDYSSIIVVSQQYTHSAELSLFPNPAEDRLTVLSGFDPNTLAQARLISISGHELRSFIIRDSRQNIDIAELEEGVYYIEVQTGTDIMIKRFIKN